MKKKSLLLFLPLMLIGCNNSNVNSTKSPFNDSYKPIGMTGKYQITKEMEPNDYANLVTCINNNYEDNKSNSVVNNYTKTDEIRDLKAAYFGKNIGAANLCSLTHQVDNNTRYNKTKETTTKFSDAHKEDQNVSGGINKVNSHNNVYYNAEGTTPTTFNETKQSWIESETPKVTRTSSTYSEDAFALKPYNDDIKTFFGEKQRGKSKITFNVLAENNKAVYGMCNDKYLIKEGASLFEPYSTIVGDTYKAVNNYFYEALLEKSGDSFRFVDFRYYTELLILSQPISNEGTVPVLYLDKPQLVEYREVKYSISYRDSISACDTFNGTIPEPTV